MIRSHIPAAIGLLLAVTFAWSAEPDFSQVPGVVVAHSPASSGIYLGSAGDTFHYTDGVWARRLLYSQIRPAPIGTPPMRHTCGLLSSSVRARLSGTSRSHRNFALYLPPINARLFRRESA
jgi:hypothetical protein